MGFKDAFKESGIKIRFLCPKYIKEKLRRKWDKALAHK